MEDRLGLAHIALSPAQLVIKILSSTNFKKKILFTQMFWGNKFPQMFCVFLTYQVLQWALNLLVIYLILK